jgi:hypothetical protein
VREPLSAAMVYLLDIEKCFDRFVKDFTRIAITCERFIAFLNKHD